jgi:hypothetical protein
MKKTEGRKSRDTVPLNLVCLLIRLVVVLFLLYKWGTLSKYASIIIFHTFQFAKLCYHARMRVWWCQWYDRISTVPRMIITSLIWYHVNAISSVVDPKLFFSDPDPIFHWDLDPDPTWLVKSFKSSFGSDPKYSLSHNANGFKYLFIDFKASFSKQFLVSFKFSFGSGFITLSYGSGFGKKFQILTDPDPDPHNWWSVIRNCEISEWMRIWILGFFPKSKDPDPTFINQGLDPVPC